LKTTTKYGRWEKHWICGDCDSMLSEYDVYFSDGICPFCGEKNGIGMKVNHYTKIRRKVKIVRYFFGILPWIIEWDWEYK